MCQVRQAIVVTGGGAGTGVMSSARTVPPGLVRTDQAPATGSHEHSAADMPAIRAVTRCQA